MRIAVITLFPEMFRALSGSGITRRAIDNKLVDLLLINPRQFTTDKHQTVDDRPYGGGPGMVMRVEPLQKALAHGLTLLALPKERVKVVYLSPQGQTLNHAAVIRYAADSRHVDGKGLVLIAGRYEGVDERFIAAHVDEELSIGDYVLSGGELPAMVLIDALIRQLPGALGDEQSAQQDSFNNGLLDYPHYTRPEQVGGVHVPPVLLCGDHKRIAQWRLKQSLGRTYQRRPDVLARKSLTDVEHRLLDEYVKENS